MGSLPRDLNRQIQDMVQIIIYKDAVINALESKVEDLQWPISRDGILRWPVKLQLILSGCESGSVFISRDFYTREGHRMAAQLQLNARDDVSEGISFSLFAQLKEGPDDASIGWPFPYSSVSFQVRRHDGRDPWEQVYPVDHRDQMFNCPAGDENERFGFENFISLDDLLNHDNKLIEDDTVSIMISVNE